ncbi:hypothetical protein SAMN04490200_5861 [Pseudomonas proteolytica]|nr:hypothetical protein SAMN04490200_5861 [Pseudomonas proteolytica]
MPAMALDQPPKIVTEPPLSRASPLPQGSVAGPGFWSRQGSHVGAGLPAMAVYLPPKIATEPPRSRASPPTGGWWQVRDFGCDMDLMWELACLRWRCTCHQRLRLKHRFREQARSHRGLVAGPGFWLRHGSHVGAGLPAMAVYLPPKIATETPLSRASRIVAPPLPQGGGDRSGILVATWITCGSWLAGYYRSQPRAL